MVASTVLSFQLRMTESFHEWAAHLVAFPAWSQVRAVPKLRHSWSGSVV